jgi:hypothetical protein
MAVGLILQEQLNLAAAAVVAAAEAQHSLQDQMQH